MNDGLIYSSFWNQPASESCVQLLAVILSRNQFLQELHLFSKRDSATGWRLFWIITDGFELCLQQMNKGGVLLFHPV